MEFVYTTRSRGDPLGGWYDHPPDSMAIFLNSGLFEPPYVIVIIFAGWYNRSLLEEDPLSRFGLWKSVRSTPPDIVVIVFVHWLDLSRIEHDSPGRHGLVDKSVLHNRMSRYDETTVAPDLGESMHIQQSALDFVRASKEAPIGVSGCASCIGFLLQEFCSTDNVTGVLEMVRPPQQKVDVTSLRTLLASSEASHNAAHQVCLAADSGNRSFDDWMLWSSIVLKLIGVMSMRLEFS